LGECLIRTKGTKITAGKMSELHSENGEIKIFAGGKTVAMVNYGDIPNGDICKIPSVIVKSRGIIEFEYYDKPFSHKNEFWSYHSSNPNLKIKYVYYFLKTKEDYFQNIASIMQMPQISIRDTEKFQIPIPPLSEQERIVSILDKFEEMVNKSLPEEIEARRKQYEYYREKLLAFN
jgi:type I restriction enzyme S subunit